MKTNLIKRIITIASAVTVTLAIGAGGAFAQGVVPDNGTVKDGNLIWLKNANCFGSQNWNQAMSSAAGLKSGMCGLTDGSTAGQWRLPTKDELVRKDMYMQGYYNAQKASYWSSSAEDSDSAWAVNVDMGMWSVHYKSLLRYVWPVRAAK